NASWSKRRCRKHGTSSAPGDGRGGMRARLARPLAPGSWLLAFGPVESGTSMVRLDRIYTRGGDRGETSLGDGSRVAKTHPRIAACGAVDELNAALGVAVVQRGLIASERDLLRAIQNDLFDVGADLSVPQAADASSRPRLRVAAEQVQHLEQSIDAYTARL